MAVLRMRNTKYAILPLFMAECPKFSRHTGNRVEEHDDDVRFQTGSRNMAVSRMRSEKYAIKRLYMVESPKFPHRIGNRGRGTRW